MLSIKSTLSCPGIAHPEAHEGGRDPDAADAGAQGREKCGEKSHASILRPVLRPVSMEVMVSLPGFGLADRPQQPALCRACDSLLSPPEARTSSEVPGPKKHNARTFRYHQTHALRAERMIHHAHASR